MESDKQNASSHRLFPSHRVVIRMQMVIDVGIHLNSILDHAQIQLLQLEMVTRGQWETLMEDRIGLVDDQSVYHILDTLIVHW